MDRSKSWGVLPSINGYLKNRSTTQVFHKKFIHNELWSGLKIPTLKYQSMKWDNFIKYQGFLTYARNFYLGSIQKVLGSVGPAPPAIWHITKLGGPVMPTWE